MKNFLLSILALGAFCSSLNAQLYSVTNIGSLGGGYTEVYDVSNSGYVVGYSTDSGGNGRGFIWDSVNGIVSVPTYGGNMSALLAINNNNLAVGYANDGSGNFHGFTYTTSGTMTDVGLPADGTVNVLAFGINDSGQVSLQTNGGAHSGFRWDSGTFSAGYTGTGFARHINNLGNFTSFDGGTGVYYITNGDTVNGFSGLPGSTLDTAYGINDNNDISGWSNVGGVDQAWVRDGTTTILNPIGSLNGESTSAWYINNAGEVVGMSGVSGVNHAFYYSGGTMIDLNNFLDASGAGWVLNWAASISDTGLIVGQGTFGGQTLGFMLTPVPEPSTYALVAGGLSLLALARRRKS